MSLALVVPVCALLTCDLLYQIQGEPSAIVRDINSIANRVGSPDTDPKAVEAEFLALLNKYTDPKDTGRIYAALAEAYCQSGLGDPFSAEKYARKALEYPLDDVLKMKVYTQCGEALVFQNWNVTGAELARVRREAVVPFLRGVRIALDNGVPDEQVLPPEWCYRAEYYSGPDQSEAEKSAKLNELRTETIRKTHITNYMVNFRDACGNLIVDMYKRKPFATDELRRIATDILQDEKAVGKLVSRVEAEVSARMASETKETTNEILKQAGLDELPDFEGPVAPAAASSEPEFLSTATTLVPPTARAPGRPASQVQPSPRPASLTWFSAGITGLAVIGAVLWLVARRRRAGPTMRATESHR